MSGNALTGKCEINRIPTINHLQKLHDQITNLVGKSNFRDLNYHLRRTVHLSDKAASFGDLDLIVSAEYLIEKEITGDRIAATLGSKAWAENGRVWSFEFMGHQVDFIRVPSETVYFNSILLGHNGGGHLFRYIPRPFGFRLDEEGLVEVLKDGGQTFDRIRVTRDWDTSRNLFLTNPYIGTYSYGYGFASLAEVYEAVLGCELFTLSAFDINEEFEYVGKPSRLEYPPYRGFVEYVKQKGALKASKGEKNPWPLTPTSAQVKRLQSKMKSMSSYWEARKFAFEEYTRQRLLRSKFSGELVMAATGLPPGNDLGLFMEAYRASFSSRGEFEFHLLSSTPQTIIDSLQSFYVGYEEKRLQAIKAKLVVGNDAEIIAFG